MKGSLIGRWSVGGERTTYQPLFYGAACSVFPYLLLSSTFCHPQFTEDHGTADPILKYIVPTQDSALAFS